MNELEIENELVEYAKHINKLNKRIAELNDLRVTEAEQYSKRINDLEQENERLRDALKEAGNSMLAVTQEAKKQGMKRAAEIVSLYQAHQKYDGIIDKLAKAIRAEIDNAGK